MDRIDRYERYMKKCEAMGNDIFKFYVGSSFIALNKYIPNKETYRKIVIPEFVNNFSSDSFNCVKQSLRIIYKNSETKGMDFCFSGFLGKELDLSEFRTDNVTDMSSMFLGCINMKKLNINNFNTDKVINMEYMFMQCIELEKVDLSGCNTTNVENMERMFFGCENLREVNINNISKNNKEMFKNTESLVVLRVADNETIRYIKNNRDKMGLSKGVDVTIIERKGIDEE